MKKIFSLILALLLISGVCYAKIFDITLMWDKNTESDLAGYNMYIRDPNQEGFVKLPDIISADANTVVITTNIDSKKYFAITAYDSYGNESGFSNQVPFDPNINPPANPTGLDIKNFTINVTIEVH